MPASPSGDFACELSGDGFAVRLRGRTVLRHAADAPAFFVGCGRLAMSMYRGNFEIEDYLEERAALRHVSEECGRIVLRRHAGDRPQFSFVVEPEADGIALVLAREDAGVDRVWLRLVAEAGERVWGCGEQFSHLDLRGRHFPLWVSEPGVGRDKTTEVTWRADATGKAGGDYHHTYYPQPTFLSARGYYAHLETSRYAAFDFRHEGFHELFASGVPERLVLGTADDLPGLVVAVSARFGRQPPLPEWITGGVVLGLKRGEEHARARLDQARRAGIPVAGVWCEDWSGIRETSFGTRLFWNWEWEPKRYPTLDRWIEELGRDGVRFLAYANPNLCTDGALFAEAEALGHLVLDESGGTSAIDFGEFDCGTVDLTSPAAADWLKARILRRNMLDLAIAGWMADFGEYLPTTGIRLASGAEPEAEHNRWPVRWAQANAEAVAEAGRTGDAVFFMRAGFSGVQRHCPLFWGGDQSVDFSRHDGIGTAITAALSAGLMGNAFHHSDIGGYTSLFGNVRTAELHMRWAEMAAFTPVMRTHETNRPQANVQWFDSEELAAHLGRMARVHARLGPYLRAVVAEGAARGLPAQRPLFLHFPEDPAVAGVEDQYLLGPDLLVAPVLGAGLTERAVVLPGGAEWVHLWSGRRMRGRASVPVPYGEPAVFWRAGTPWEETFAAVAGTGRPA
jgi:sulfoquinovosidase